MALNLPDISRLVVEPHSPLPPSPRPPSLPHPLQIFFRGGPLLWVSDSPQRAKILCHKHANNSTKYPCPYCTAEQIDNHPTGGPLGDPGFTIEAHRRTWGVVEDSWAELLALESNPREQAKRSMELGVVAPTSISGGDWGRPLWDYLMIDPLRTVPVEAFHADSLVSPRFPRFFLARVEQDSRRVRT